MGLFPGGGRRLSITALTSLLLMGTLAGAVAGGGQSASAASGRSVGADSDPVNNSLGAVSCASTTSCMAVGFYDTDADVAQTLIESYDGTSWSIVPSPDVPTADGGILDNQLDGVSCTSDSDCMAVGNTNNDGDDTGVAQTVAELWDGTSWTILPTPDEGTGDNLLTSVDCTSATSCVAVGSWDGTADSLIETWNGTDWSVVPSPTPTGGGAYLAGVSCVAATDCMAVGGSPEAGNNYAALAESWDGTNWSIVPTPDVGTGANFVYGVSCPSADACVAVGVTDTGNVEDPGVWSMLSESWDGTGWSVMTGGHGWFTGYGVSCTDATTCEAVGQDYDSENYGSLALQLDAGVGWINAGFGGPNPNPDPTYDGFYGVSCPVSTSCVAVGVSGERQSRTLIETMDSAGYWTVVSSPNATSPPPPPPPPPPPAPTIRKTSRQGRPGKNLTILGTNLAGATVVAINGTPVTRIFVDGAEKIVARVPVGATSGYIQVTTAGGTATSTKIFTVKPKK